MNPAEQADQIVRKFELKTVGTERGSDYCTISVTWKQRGLEKRQPKDQEDTRKSGKKSNKVPLLTDEDRKTTQAAIRWIERVEQRRGVRPREELPFEETTTTKTSIGFNSSPPRTSSYIYARQNEYLDSEFPDDDRVFPPAYTVHSHTNKSATTTSSGTKMDTSQFSSYSSTSSASKKSGESERVKREDDVPRDHFGVPLSHPMAVTPYPHAVSAETRRRARELLKQLGKNPNMLKDIYARKNMKYSDEKGEEDKKKKEKKIPDPTENYE
ncbi:hypothetical protein WR25_12106 [Diploscapter pachys]|uniref:Uncharacterized protein n=1 Tax=Diploscapter pachys TaxID=2018661 RepID=A0A2A2JGQ3_9BILA|nr:hypothetical protein WR25_12106 [Diploscapter pachys]